jgi:hypothetical protein
LALLALLGLDMTLLVSDAIAHIRHTLASEDVPSIGAYRILNDAGQYMVNMHNWRWCEGVQQTLSLTANQDYVWLPEDFREIIAVQPTNGLNAGFRLTTQERLLQLRSLAVSNSFEYHGSVVHAPRGAAATATLLVGSLVNGTSITMTDAYNPSTTISFKTTVAATDVDSGFTRYMAIGATSAASAVTLAAAINDAPNLYLRASVSGSTITVTHQRDGTRGNSMTMTVPAAITMQLLDTGVDGGPVRARLDLWPTPSQDELDRVMVYYRRGWQSCDSDNALIPIPDWIESLYVALVRAYARGYERESEASLEQRIAEVKAGPQFAAAMLRDKEMVAHMGPLSGGAAQGSRSMYDHLWNFTTVNDPT